MAMYYNGRKVRNLYFNGKCITRLALGKEMTRLVEGDDFVRAQWLKGRNGAYIDTAYYPVFGTDVFDCHFRYDGTLRNPDDGEQDAFGISGDSNCRISVYINSQNNLTCTYFKETGSYPTTAIFSKEWIVSDLMVSGTDFIYTANGIVYTLSNNSMPRFTAGKSMYLFKRNGNAISYLHGDIAYFNIEPNKVRMTPCRLLRPIPASLDGNGIARNAGECGMFDAVSGKFYGNVGSGTFTVEPSLVEGVDYQRHKWLRAEVDVAATMCLLPTDSNIIEFKSKRIRGRNFHYFRTDGDYVYFCATGLQKAIYNYNTSATIYYSSIVALGEEVIISCNDSKILMGSDELPIYGYPINDVRISVADSEGMETLTSSITVDGIERYIPVRLLRPLPSYLDANGKARKQYECGMLDLKTMKFYGNVANKGNFTVSDN